MSDEIKGARGIKSSVRANGHPASGGHAHTARVRDTTKPNNSSAFSRANRPRWDWSDGLTGDNMAYQYCEYPKHVHPDPHNHKHFVVVNSAEEERQVLGGEEVINEEIERKRLLALAAVKKLPVDKRWGPAKLTKAIEDAGHDPTLDPFK